MHDLNHCRLATATLRAIIITLVSCWSMSSLVSATLIEHQGATDPTTEGFTLSAGGGTHSETGVLDSGTAAWQITTDENAYSAYVHDFTAPELATLTSNGDGRGVVFTVRLRIQADPTTVTDENIVAEIAYGGNRYAMRFGIDGSGDFVVTPVSWFSYTVAGGNDYHTIQMIDNDADGDFDFYIDGALQANPGYGGTPNAAERAAFGDFTGSLNGSSDTIVNWATFDVNVIPEPSTLLLLAAGAGVLTGAHRRWQRHRGTSPPATL
jgi:hypothetical protein